MDRKEYAQWATNHATVFGFAESGGAMIAAWFEIFNGFGYTVAELKAATTAMARTPPTFPNEHLTAVQAAVAAHRGRRLAALGPAPGEIGTCALCHDSGHAFVPHATSVEGGRLVSSALAAVQCSCWAGRRAAEKFELASREERLRLGRQLTLGEYERSVPQWRTLLREFEAAQAASVREQGPPVGTEFAGWGRMVDSADRAYLSVIRRLKAGERKSA